MHTKNKTAFVMIRDKYMINVTVYAISKKKPRA